MLFHSTLYNGRTYLSKLGLKLNHVSKGDQCSFIHVLLRFSQMQYETDNDLQVKCQ